MTTCRLCGSETIEALSLGDLYPSAFLAKGEFPQQKYPLTLVECASCGLVQLSENPPLDTMYRTYWYRSAANPTMIADLAGVTRTIESKTDLSEGDLVIDIGCNDGALFTTYSQKKIVTVGFDPALNLNPGCDIFFNDYFPNGASLSKKAKVITSIAVFYDLPDPRAFIEGVKEYLAEDGMWVLQLTDLASMLQVNAFDNICHEHLEIYSLKILVDLMEQHGLRVFHVSHNKVNGGSLRVFISYPGAYCKTTSVEYWLDQERGVIYSGWAGKFQRKIEDLKSRTCAYVAAAVAGGKTVALLGASTKGNTLLQVFGLDHTVIDHAAEINSDKFGLRTVGTDIPIISQQESLGRHPDIYLVLPWHFASFFIKKPVFIEYMLNGGELFFPMPDLLAWAKDNRGKLSGRFIV